MISKSMRRAWMFGPVLSLSVALAGCNNGPVPASKTSTGGGGNGSGPRASSGSNSGSGDGTGTGTPINLDPGATSTGVTTSTEVTEQQACAVKTNEATKQRSDLLLILDRSSSMQNAMDSDSGCTGGGLGGRRDASASTCQTRWAVVQSTLKQVLASSETNVNWGLSLFSDPDQRSSCVVADDPQVKIGAGNAKDILDRISKAGTATSTPTRLAIKAGIKYLQSLQSSESKSILLATDGQPNCAESAGDADGGFGGGFGGGGVGGDDVEATKAAIKAAHDAGFKVYILGIGPETNTTTLNEFAEAGGTAVDDVGGPGKKYYAALSAEELAKNFDNIVSSVASCSFSLDKAPDDSVPIVVEFDGDKSKRAPKDSANGWSFASDDRKTIQLNGSWCDGLMKGTYQSAKVLVACKGYIF